MSTTVEQTQPATQTTTPRYRFRVELDEDFVPEGCDGKPLPESPEQYAQNPHHALINLDDDPQTGARRVMPYEEYAGYYGNPDRHVGLSVYLDVLCPHCKHWDRGVQSLHGIDIMDDNPEALAVGTSATRADQLPGYLAEVARELLAEHEG